MPRRCVKYVGMLTASTALAIIAGCPAPPGQVAGDGASAGNIFDPFNRAPSAAASVDPGSGIKPAMTVKLDASGSSDPDGDGLSFEWQQLSGMPVALSSSNDATITFSAPLAVETSELRFSVTVRDGRGGEASAEAGLVVEVGAEFAGNAQGTSPYRESLTTDEAYHLLRRAAFGATPEQVAAAVQRGLSATVDDLMSDKAVPAELSTLVDSYEDSIPHRWLLMSIDGPNPLRERVAMFWHDRFATSRRVLNFNDRNLAVLHWDMLRRNALGNYRQFLKELTLDPLMLIWLDNGNSPKDNPNENYAREFWELFTVGRDVLYTEQDIKESARAFTGITLLRQQNKDARPIYDLLNHDETPKLIFPSRTAGPANYNYEAVIDLTLQQPEAARYVARNLWKCLVHDSPSDAVVEDLAKSFQDSNFEIAPLVKRILKSQAMFAPEALGNQIASPAEHWIGVARTLDMHAYAEDSQGYLLDRTVDDLRAAGQDLLNPPGVEGWSENTGWLQDQWVLNRVNALSRTMDYGPGRVADLPYHLLPPTSEWNQREVRGRIVDAIANAFHLKLTQAEKDIYIEVLDQKGYLAFHLERPDYQDDQVWEMIRLMAMDERVIGR
ncbi:MAG: DUF1800 family protein [Phycisphaerae bacterium]